MSRILTTYRRPSIGDLIRSAPNIEALSQLRAQIGERFLAGKIDAADRTIRDWREAIYTRLVHLIAAATTPEECSYIYNCSFRWYVDDTIRGPLEAFMLARAAALPDASEHRRAAGIEVEGRAA